MRPDVLNPLFAEAEALKGVGPGIAKALARLDLTRARSNRCPSQWSQKLISLSRRAARMAAFCP